MDQRTWVSLGMLPWIGVTAGGGAGRLGKWKRPWIRPEVTVGGDGDELEGAVGL